MSPEIQSTEVSASDMDVLCNAYREMVGNATLDDEVARRRALELVIDLTGAVEVDDEMISRVIRRWNQ
jgi:hypothetical protein